MHSCWHHCPGSPLMLIHTDIIPTSMCTLSTNVHMHDCIHIIGRSVLVHWINHRHSILWLRGIEYLWTNIIVSCVLCWFDVMLLATFGVCMLVEGSFRSLDHRSKGAGTGSEGRHSSSQHTGTRYSGRRLQVRVYVCVCVCESMYCIALEGYVVMYV